MVEVQNYSYQLIRENPLPLFMVALGKTCKYDSDQVHWPYTLVQPCVSYHTEYPYLHTYIIKSREKLKLESITIALLRLTT